MAKHSDLLKKVQLVSLSAIFFSVAPFLFLSFFAYPNAEDISLSIVPRDLGVFPSMYKLFIEFDGRYFTNLIFGYNPLTYNCYNCYPLVPFTFLIAFVTSNYFVVRRLIQANKTKSMIISGLCSSFYLVFLPSTPHGIYWVASSVVFLLPIIMLNFLVGTLIQYSRTTSYVKKMFQCFFIVLLTLAIIGTNEMFLLIVNGLFFILILYHIWKQEKNNIIRYLYFFGISLMASINFLIAPGIRKRWEYLDGDRIEPTPGILEIAFQIIKDILVFSAKIFIQPYASILILIAAWWIVNQVTLTKAKRNEIIAFAIIIMIGLYVALFAYYIPMGYTSFFPYRVFNVFIYFFLLSILFLVVAMFYERLKAIPIKVIFGLTMALFILIPLSKNTATAYSFIAQNKHQKHRKEMLEMLNTMQQAGADEIVYVKNPTNMESIISYPPYVSDSNTVWNQQYADYFNLKGIKLVE